MAIVADASPLIGPAQIGQLDLLHSRFIDVWMPPAVARETRASVPAQPWLHPRTLNQPVHPRIIGARLGPGESEAISLALESGGMPILLDELRARRLAQSLGLPVIGTLGVLLEAKSDGPISELRPHLDALRAVRFFMAPGLYDQMLAAADEL